MTYEGFEVIVRQIENDVHLVPEDFGTFLAPPGIFSGEIYLSNELNEYVIVTKSSHHEITYAGYGIKGKLEDEYLVTHFGPVDPEDVDQEELSYLLSLCPKGTSARFPFILEDSKYYRQRGCEIKETEYTIGDEDEYISASKERSTV